MITEMTMFYQHELDAKASFFCLSEARYGIQEQ